MPAQKCPLSQVAPGMIVSIPVIGFRHLGIVTDRAVGGFPTVISNTSACGGVVEQTWQDFCGGASVRVDGYPSALPPPVVLARARSMLGSRYRLSSWNCEHLTHYAHGLRPQSPQLSVVVLIAAVALMFRLGT